MESNEPANLPCHEKLAYDTQKEAWAASTVLRFQRGVRLKAYKCKHCGLWHLSSKYDQ